LPTTLAVCLLLLDVQTGSRQWRASIRPAFLDWCQQYSGWYICLYVLVYSPHSISTHGNFCRWLWSPAIALANSEDDYFADISYFLFSLPDFSTFFNRHFRNFATWRDCFQQNLCCTASPKVPPKTNEGAKTPNFADFRTGPQRL